MEFSPQQILGFATGLVCSEDREKFIRQFSKAAGIDMLIIFIPDPELKMSLAAPGFPQTLPCGKEWRRFVEKCIESGEARGMLPWPDATQIRTVSGFGTERYGVVIVGETVPGTLIQGLKLIMPVLAAALSGERALLARTAHTEMAAQAAREAHALALSLDQARNAAQQEAAARAHAERELQKELVEHKLAEEKLRQIKEELEKTNRELDQRVQEKTASLQEAVAQMEEFSYSVSHDLRAPLRAMNAYAHALLQDYDGKLDERAGMYLQKIVRGSQRMEQLTGGLLQYSRVARDDLPLAHIELDRLLGEIIPQYIEFQPPTEMTIESPLGTVVGHELSLGQAIANLLTNAVKFSKPGTHPKVRIYTEASGPSLRLLIEDQGIGIDPALQPRLFKLFERMHPKAGIEGTGIGLAIVRKAVEKMGGSVGVRSDGKTGSIFWIQLPQAPPHPQTLEQKIMPTVAL